MSEWKPGVLHGTEPRTPQKRTRMRSELITGCASYNRQEKCFLTLFLHCVRWLDAGGAS